MSNTKNILNQRSLSRGVQGLVKCDKDLAKIVIAFGHPPLWAREPGFPTLIHIILEQQVSLASARAAFERLAAALDPFTPENFLLLSDEQLKEIGFSRQKTRYGRVLAAAVLSGQLDLFGLSGLSDHEAKAELLQIKGVGPWTADIYLLTALGRPDIWPQGDLALAAALQQLKGLPTRPVFEEQDQISAAWRPWRSVAARLLWHYYLSAGQLRIRCLDG